MCELGKCSTIELRNCVHTISSMYMSSYRFWCFSLICSKEVAIFGNACVDNEYRQLFFDNTNVGQLLWSL